MKKDIVHILEMMRETPGRCWSLAELTTQTGISPDEIQSALTEAATMGQGLHHSPAGWLLDLDHLRLDGDWIQLNLCTQRIGKSVLVLKETDSANDEAWRIFAEKGSASDGWVIFSEHQRQGRGRRGAEWIDLPFQSILMSVIIAVPVDSAGHLMTLAAGIAAADAIRNGYQVDARLKWPNDVVVDGRKLAGVMVERRGPAVVVGIGINCGQTLTAFPAELQQHATSIRRETERPTDRIGLARELIRELDFWLEKAGAGDDTAIHDRWMELSSTVGRRIVLDQSCRRFSGTVVDVSPREGLLVRLDEGGVRLFDPATTTLGE